MSAPPGPQATARLIEIFSFFEAENSCPANTITKNTTKVCAIITLFTTKKRQGSNNRNIQQEDNHLNAKTPVIASNFIKYKKTDLITCIFLAKGVSYK